jgi:hypothetical protein
MFPDTIPDRLAEEWILDISTNIALYAFPSA